MTGRARIRASRGFSLVELLVVMVILGIVMMSIMSLYLSTQRTAFTQEEVVEVQQSLRIALDQLGRDIRMAGFMIPSGAPIGTASSTTFTMRTATAVGRIAQVGADFTSPAADPAASVTIAIDSADMVDLFESGDIVRIIRSPVHSQPIDDTFEVSGKSRNGPTINLKDFDFATATQYKAGDVIVRTTASAPHPNTVTYALSGTDLQRITNVGTVAEDTEVVADKITALVFNYLKDNDNTRYSSVTTTAELQKIRAVEVTVTASTAVADGVKTREITNLFSIRNR